MNFSLAASLTHDPTSALGASMFSLLAARHPERAVFPALYDTIVS
jgi:hypothetical protein